MRAWLGILSVALEVTSTRMPTATAAAGPHAGISQHAIASGNGYADVPAQLTIIWHRRRVPRLGLLGVILHVRALAGVSI